MKRTKIIFILSAAALLISGCWKNEWAPTTSIVFIDYTSSCPALDGSNRERVKQQLLDLAEKLKMHEEIIIYPIHASTLSAIPITVIKFPRLKGDLTDRQTIRKWLDKDVGRQINTVIDYSFSAGDIAGTNVFATLRKANMALKNGKNIKLYYVSDMLHELDDNNSFKNDFPNMSETEIRLLANKKAKKYCPGNSLNNVPVYIFLPGVPNGTKEDDLYHAIYCFWDEFFISAGTTARIKELS